MGTSDETLWRGRPPTGVIFRFSDFFAIPFSLVWGGLAFSVPFAMARSGQLSKDGAWPLAIIPVVLFPAAGLYVIVGRFLVDILRRRSLRYELTAREAVIRGGLLRKVERRVDYRRVPEVGIQRHRDGSGTLTFGTPRRSDAGYEPFGNGPSVPAFEHIGDAERVYAIVMQARASSG